MTEWRYTHESTGPIEVWLTNRVERTYISCTVVREDESTATISVDSLTMRGAQAEVTGHVKSRGYEPAGPWEIVQDGREDPIETMRRFDPRLPTTDDQEESGS